MPAKPKNEPMCAVKIGFYTYLMPAAIGMKVVQLLTQAVACEEHYEGGHGLTYEAGDQVDVSYCNVRNNQIRMPKGAMAPEPRRLTKQPLALGFDE